MLVAANKAGKMLDVAFSHRSRSDIVMLKSILDGGGLGRIYYAKAEWRRSDGIPAGADNWFHSKSLAGGGSLIDLGVHLLDLLLFLLDEPEVATVSASTSCELMRSRASSRSSADTVEDLGVVMLRLVDGATLAMEVSWAIHGSGSDDLRISLYGSLGGAELEAREYAWANTLRLFSVGPDGLPIESVPELSSVDRHAATVKNFISLVESRSDGNARGEAALKRARILDACYTSAGQGAEVALRS